MRRVVFMFVVAAAAGCATVPRSPIHEADRARIRELASQPLPQFLSRYYTTSVGDADEVRVGAQFGFFVNEEVRRPRAEMAELCSLQEGQLYRVPNRQGSWIDVSPEAFSDPRRSGYADLHMKSLCYADALNPGCGAAKASRDGAFGQFQCRARSGERLLWAVSIEGSPGVVVSQTPKMAKMTITLRPIKQAQ